MVIIMMRLEKQHGAKMMILALLEGRRSGGLLTKATNHGGLDKSCHPATITQSENDSTTSTRLHKSNASESADYIVKNARKIKWSNRFPLEFQHMQLCCNHASETVFFHYLKAFFVLFIRGYMGLMYSGYGLQKFLHIWLRVGPGFF